MDGPTEKLPEPTDLGVQAASWLKLLGGEKTTTSPGDTTALQSTLGQLQGTDYEAMLKAIFQQAGGQIPGLQQALGNAIGARSGGNSAVQAALQKLLAQTSTGAMDQVAKLQAQNMATQANVGQSIAQATQGTTKQTGTNVGGGLTEAAKLIALLQGAKTLGVDKWIKDLTSATPEQTVSPAMTSAATNAFTSTAAPLSTAETPMFNLTTGGAFQPTTPVAPAATTETASSTVPGVPQITDQGFQFTDMTGFQQPYVAPTYTPSFDVAPAPEIPYDTYEETFTFADGGIVRGRGNSTAPMEPSDTPAAETAEDEGEAVANARFDKGFTANKFLDTFRELLGNNDLGKAEGYADGGTVRAGGSRRSANPTVDITGPDTMLAKAAADELRGQFGMQGQQAQALSSPVSTLAGSDIANLQTGTGDLTSGGNTADISFGTAGTPSGISAADFGTAVGKAGAISNISGIFGGPTLGPLGQVLGLSAGLANAQTPEQALGVVGKSALGIAAPQAMGIANFAMNPTQVNAINTLAATIPIGALWGGISALTGAPSIGEVALGAPQSITGSPVSGGLVNEATSGLFGAGGELGGNPAMSSPVSGPGEVTTTDLGTLGSDTGGDSSVGGNTADTADNSNQGAGAQEADGGPIDGPGTGTSDSIPAKLSDGEFVMSADVVEALGEDFFNQLQAAFHTPAAQQRARTA